MRFSRESGAAIFIVLATMLLFCFSTSETVSAAQESKSSAAPAGNVENGKRLFMKDGCYQCHGREGQGSVMSGPRIAPDPVPLEVLLRYVRKPSGEMPPYTEKVISDQELTDIYAYLQSRPHPPTAKANALLK
jgi:ubiquinol-cytochrome c reductase cytochrome c subunit